MTVHLAAFHLSLKGRRRYAYINERLREESKQKKNICDSLFEK